MQTMTHARPTMRLQPRLVPVPSLQSADADDVLLSDGAAPAMSLDSIALLRGQKTVEIVHNGSVYRLQATRLGKLILTK